MIEDLAEVEVVPAEPAILPERPAGVPPALERPFCELVPQPAITSADAAAPRIDTAIPAASNLLRMTATIGRREAQRSGRGAASRRRR